MINVLSFQDVLYIKPCLRVQKTYSVKQHNFQLSSTLDKVVWILNQLKTSQLFAFKTKWQRCKMLYLYFLTESGIYLYHVIKDM